MLMGMSARPDGRSGRGVTSRRYWMRFGESFQTFRFLRLYEEPRQPEARGEARKDNYGGGGKGGTGQDRDIEQHAASRRAERLTGELVLVAAIGIAGNGVKHPLGLIEGATENSAVVQALIDNLVARGLDPAVPRLFIIDGSKALSKAIRRTFGRDALTQRCQIHKARNIMERLPKPLHAAVRRVLRQA